MKDKKFFILTTSILAALLLLIGGVNYWVDFYGVFRGVNQEIIENNYINDRFVKMEYLLENENYEKYDSFLWGSSRIQKMDPQVARPHMYNMGAAGGLPGDCLRELFILLKYGYKPQAVYLGFDNFSYTRRRIGFNMPLHIMLYSEEPMKRAVYYSELLLQPQLAYDGLKRKFNSGPMAQTFLHKNGMYLLPKNRETLIERDPESYVRQKEFLEPSGNKSINKKAFADCISTIRQIKQICDENGIEFIPFFNPQHITTYMICNMEEMNRFKKELVKISPFWDFSGINVITVNNYFWYETSHPRNFVCDKILDKVSGKNQITWVPDFGVYVTPKNVDAFCEKAVKDREKYDPKRKQWVPNEKQRAAMTKRINYPW